MKHRSISHTTTPSGYITHPDPKKHTNHFNKWANYIHKEVKKLNLKS